MPARYKLVEIVQSPSENGASNTGNLKATGPVTAKQQPHQQLVNLLQGSNHHAEEQEPTDEETESEAPPLLVHNNIGAQ